MIFIEHTNESIFDSECQALVNPVNCEGVMGKGLALEFKKRYPKSFSIYQFSERKIGKMIVCKETLPGKDEKIIIHFPTKNKWRNASKYDYIRSGVQDLVEQILEKDIKSIAIPALGCGLGELEWDTVKNIIQYYLSSAFKPDCEVHFYSPHEST
jgi:O-acetyl-ADP-ribose deacetylase (regulator of RNase III)